MNPAAPITYIATPVHGPANAGLPCGLAFADIADATLHVREGALVSPRRQRGMRSADEWPLRTFLELGALPGAVPCARLHARHLLWEWGLADLQDAAELIVAELLTNAIKASQEMAWGPPVRLWLLSDKARLLILVWDANPRPPIRADATSEDEAGRGLLLVEAVSSRWGWCGGGEHGGKVIWADVEAE